MSKAWSYEKKKDGKDEWLTPPFIIEALGDFELDPCAPIDRPWDTAKEHYSIIDDGLSKEWHGRVWLNPPYGRNTMNTWMRKMAHHSVGTALVYARTDTRWFHEHVFQAASALFFFKGRLKFHHVDGTQGGSAGAPSVLATYGNHDKLFLRYAVMKHLLNEGRYIELK